MRIVFSKFRQWTAAAYTSLTSALRPGILWLLLVAAFAIYLLYDSEKFAPRTEGSMFVETPQVYTRERLVNDRFIQENWLRKVLETEPDFSPSEIASITTSREINISGPSGSAGTSDGSGKAAALSKSDAASGRTGGSAVATRPHIPPQVQFLLRNAYRELVRSHLIENQLDDRHDIRGTTLYLLKFDVSIIPGNNTRKRAYVRARISRDTRTTSAGKGRSITGSIIGSTNGKAKDTENRTAPTDERQHPASAQDYFVHYINHPELFSGFVSPEDDPNLVNWQLYDQWRLSLEQRLNTALRNVVHRFDANEFRYSEYEEFLSMLAEEKGEDVYSVWAVALAKLRDSRDQLRTKLTGKAEYRIEALDHRFHVVAKSLLRSAITGSTIYIERLLKILTEDQVAPEIDETRLRAELHKYAVRRLGLSMFGDPHEFEIKATAEF